MRALFAVACLVSVVACSRKAPEPEYFRADPATAVRVSGTVRFTGKAPESKPISMAVDEDCEKLHRTPVSGATVVVDANGSLANALVYVKSGLEGRKFEPVKEAVVLDQRGCMFVPRVVSVRAGQTVAVKNSDPVSHNIHPRPAENREWNQQQPPESPDLQRRFARPEIMIPVRCNVHSWMRAWIAVLDHPFFAVTKEDGAFEWSSLPPGDYTVAVWHETLGEITKTISVKPKDVVKLDLAYMPDAAASR
jgi:plastocyanin